MNEKVLSILKHPITAPIASGIVAFGAGFLAGRVLPKRFKGEVYEFQPKVSIQMDSSAPVGTDVLVDLIEPNGSSMFTGTPLAVVSETETEIIRQTEDDEPEEIIDRNIFATNGDGWDYHAEITQRSEAAPHVIHKDEFYGEEKGYTQSVLTYYAGDEIMVSEDDTPVYNHAQIVGELKFGHGSGDPNVVYVRNDKMKAEYEINLDPGMYSVEVLGLVIDDNERVKGLKHSTPRFRREE